MRVRQVFSEKNSMQEQIEFYAQKLRYEIDPSDLNEAIEVGEKLIPVDTRSVRAFTEKHIPGAISLPHREMSYETTEHLDRSATYVCYCTGVGCNASTKGALKLTQLGFKVKELIGGLDKWMEERCAC